MPVKTWNTEDNKKLIKYVAYCNPNELPNRTEMQRLLRLCLQIYKKKENDNV